MRLLVCTEVQALLCLSSTLCHGVHSHTQFSWQVTESSEIFITTTSAVDSSWAERTETLLWLCCQYFSFTEMTGSLKAQSTYFTHLHQFSHLGYIRLTLSKILHYNLKRVVRNSAGWEGQAEDVLDVHYGKWCSILGHNRNSTLWDLDLCCTDFDKFSNFLEGGSPTLLESL